MHIAKEFKIGIFAIITIAIFIFGFNYLKGKNILDRNNLFLIEYDNVDQLQNSSPVLVNGFHVGMVKSIYLKPSDYTKIVVEIEVLKEVKLPKTTLAEIFSTGMMGGKAINLKFNGLCSGEDCAKSGDYFTGTTKGLLASMMTVDQLEDYTNVLRTGVTQLLDTLSANLKNKDNEVGNSLRDLQASLQNLRSTTSTLDKLMSGSKNDIALTLDNLETISSVIRANTDQIKSIIANAEAFSGQLKSVDLPGTAAETKIAITHLKTTLTTADKALRDIGTITEKIKNSEGSLGMLVNDKSLVQNLESTARNLDLLLQDLRLNPKRYTRILSKRQIPYQLPAIDPAKSGN
jgi:phospholipid/cholesterol/gamma-HCH transport system substrate-binding protein